jgi:hypothetical protein
MSAITLHPADPAVGKSLPRAQVWQRTVAVARMHLVDLRTLGVIPWSIMASIFAINVIIWQFVPASGRQTGGAASIYVFLLAVAILSTTRSLPFALGMGASRRTFLLGTGLAGLTLSVAFGALLFVLQIAEHASGGWWQQGEFFWFPWFARSAHVADLLVLILSLGASFALGTLIAACWVRWGALTLAVGMPALILVGGALIVLITWRHGWDEVGRWLAGQTPLSTAGWCALAVVVLAGLSHLVLRRVRA